MKLQSETIQTVIYESWVADYESKEKIEKAVELLKVAFPEMETELIIQSHSFVEHGYDLKLKIKITGGETNV
jgi:hypothetical protein